MKISRRSLAAATMGSTFATSSLSLAGSLDPTLARQTSSSLPGSLKWKFQTIGEVSFVQEANGTIVAESGGVIYGIDAETGSGSWRAQVGSSEWFSERQRTAQQAKEHDGTVFSIGQASVVALDLKSGETKWHIDAEVGNLHLTDGILLLGVGPEYFLRREGTQAVAVDAENGEELWRSEKESLIIGVADGIVYLVDSDFNLLALDVQSRNEKWRLPIGSLHEWYSIIDQRIVLVNRREIYVIDAMDGNQLWTKEIETDWEPIFSDSAIILEHHEEHSETLFALEMDRGSELWRVHIETESLDDFFVVNEIVYFGAYNGDLTTTLHALNASTGAEEWSKYITRDGLVALTVHGGSVYAPFGSSVYVFDAENGSELWRISAEKGISTPLIVSESSVYFGNDDANVYAIAAEPMRYPSVVPNSAAIALVETPVRAAPLRSGDVIITLSAETEVFVSDSSQESGGVTWWPIIAADGTEGWVDGSMLRGKS